MKPFLMKAADREINILLVEDNEGDIVLAKEALFEAGIKNRTTVITNGEEALQYLLKKNGFYHLHFPDLILLDINLPKVDGLELLVAIKTNDALKAIPVVMLTTSTSERDVMFAYKNYVNCYINKPIDTGKLLAIIKNIESFWLNISRQPTN
jgi:chemotaxis family two-component system response regulator Rcp1